MKKMRSLLLAGLLLGLGVGASAFDSTANDDFAITLEIVEPLGIAPDGGGTIDFGTHTFNSMTGSESASQTFKVTGAEDHLVDFTVTSADELINTTAGNGLGDKIAYTTKISGTNVNAAGDQITLSVPTGEVATLEITLAETPQSVGEYTGTVNISVAYN